MTARDPPVIIMIPQHLPAFMFLTGDIGFTGLTLRIERVEILFQTLFGALACIDCTTDAAHHCTPKKRGPDHRAPVMCLAMADKDRQVLPSMT